MVRRVSALFIVSLLGVAVMSTAGKAAQKEPSTSVSTAITRNPMTQTAASQARTKEIYGYDCSMCHGQNGISSTSLDSQAGLSVPNMVDTAAMTKLSDRELYDIIWNGKGKMPPERGRATSNEVWNLVMYIRGFSDKKLAAERSATAQ